MNLEPEHLSPLARGQRAAFLGRLAHELRGPAATTSGAITEIRAMLSDPTRSGEVEGFLAMAMRGIAKILRIADRLDQTSQLERSLVKFRCQICDLASLVRHATVGAEVIARRPSVAVHCTLPLISSEFSGDPAWLSIVVLELVLNAIRHARAGVRVELKRDEEHFSIQVTNDGAPAEYFGVARFQTPRDSCGLGLSLAIVQEVADAHCGTLTVEPGSLANAAFGARVTLVLPRWPAELQSVSPVALPDGLLAR